MKISREIEGPVQGQGAGRAGRPDAAGNKFVSSLSKGSVFKGTVKGRQAGLDIIDSGGTLIRTRSEVPLPENATVSLEVTETGNPVKVRLLSVLGPGEEDRARMVARILRQMMGVRSGLAGLGSRIAEVTGVLADAGSTGDDLAELLSVISQSALPESSRNAAAAGLFQPAGQEGGFILKQLVAALASAAGSRRGDAPAQAENLSDPGRSSNADSSGVSGKGQGAGGSAGRAATSAADSVTAGMDEMAQDGPARSNQGGQSSELAAGARSGKEDYSPVPERPGITSKGSDAARRDAGGVTGSDKDARAAQGRGGKNGGVAERSGVTGNVRAGRGRIPGNSPGHKWAGETAGKFITYAASKGFTIGARSSAKSVPGAVSDPGSDKPFTAGSGQTGHTGPRGAVRNDGLFHDRPATVDNGVTEGGRLRKAGGRDAFADNGGRAGAVKGAENAAPGNVSGRSSALGSNGAARGETDSAFLNHPARDAVAVPDEGISKDEVAPKAAASARSPETGPSGRDAPKASSDYGNLYKQPSSSTDEYHEGKQPSSTYEAPVKSSADQASPGKATAAVPPGSAGNGVKNQSAASPGFAPFINGGAEEETVKAGGIETDVKGVLPGEKTPENASQGIKYTAEGVRSDTRESMQAQGRRQSSDAGHVPGRLSEAGGAAPDEPGARPDVQFSHETARRQGCEAPVARLLSAISSHADAVGQYQQHVQEFLNIPFFMFPILFEKGQGQGHWSWWKDEEQQEAGAEATEHIAFDLELTMLGRVSIHVLRQGTDITLQAAAPRDVLPILRAGMQELRERLEVVGFSFSISDIFPVEEAGAAELVMPFDAGAVPGGSSMNIVA